MPEFVSRSSMLPFEEQEQVMLFDVRIFARESRRKMMTSPILNTNSNICEFTLVAGNFDTQPSANNRRDSFQTLVSLPARFGKRIQDPPSAGRRPPAAAINPACKRTKPLLTTSGKAGSKTSNFITNVVLYEANAQSSGTVWSTEFH